MQITISDRRSDARVLAHFFSSNVTPEYISHAELQGYRALARSRWSPDLEERLRVEINARLNDESEAFPSAVTWQGVIEGRDNNGALVGVAFVSISHDCNVPHGIIEDIIIDRWSRGKGHGETMMRWLLDNFERSGIARVFLESGLSNERAHHLFERLGFKTISVVMMRGP
jgi:ribosomal protein S18 acetylase RimI-like enzyme